MMYFLEDSPNNVFRYTLHYISLQDGLPLLQVGGGRELYQGGEGEDEANPEVESYRLNMFIFKISTERCQTFG